MSTFDDDTTRTRSTSGEPTASWPTGAEPTQSWRTSGEATASWPTTEDPSVSDQTHPQSPLTDEEPRTLPRPKGPSWSTIALGLVCVVVAGGALLVEFTELSLEWDRTGPLALVGLGLLLVLVGLAALLRRSDEDPDDPRSH